MTRPDLNANTPPDSSSNGLPGAEDPDVTIAYKPEAGLALSGRSDGARPFDVLNPPRAEGELGWLAHYRVQSLIGEGGIGLVFLAEDTELARPVALKVIKPEMADASHVRSRFAREAQATASIKHDHIITIYQVGRDNDTLFLAMEFLQGLSLQAWLERGRKPSVAIVLRIGREIAAGLAAAHRHHLIHRDIKPANIWLEAPAGRVKILDFGMARSERDDVHITQSGTVMGTPTYMAPEQARGEPVGPGADLFSLGCVLYRLSTGRLPFPGASIMAVLTALSSETPRRPRELNPEVPSALDRLIMQLLAKQPENRPASAQTVVEALKTIERELLEERRRVAVVDSEGSVSELVAEIQLHSDGPDEPHTGPQEEPRRAGRRTRWIAAMVFGLAIAAAVGGFAHLSAHKNMLGPQADPPSQVGVVAANTSQPDATQGPIDPRKVQAGTAADLVRTRDDQGASQDQRDTSITSASAHAIGSRPPTVTGREQAQAQPRLGHPPQPENPQAEPSASPVEPPGEPAKTIHELAAWSDVLNPDGDCKFYHDESSDWITIGVPGTPHVLSTEIGRLNAPRLLRAVQGDFEADVRVEGVFHPSDRATMKQYAPYHGAGILLWQDANNYLRLEIAADVHKHRIRRYANYELRKDGTLAASRGIKIEDASTYLRLERRGNAFQAAFSPDGVRWTSFPPMHAKLDGRLKVGIAAINSASNRLMATLRGFHVAEPAVLDDKDSHVTIP
jgi:serine/threonine protein kinase/regulation of enolase protein 1 (concanavalin A-like superfamily)